MSGSVKPSKTSAPSELQLPLKGFSSIYKDEASGREFRIEGMGDGRYRIHSAKRPPSTK